MVLVLEVELRRKAPDRDMLVRALAGSRADWAEAMETAMRRCGSITHLPASLLDFGLRLALSMGMGSKRHLRKMGVSEVLASFRLLFRRSHLIPPSLVHHQRRSWPLRRI